MKYYKEINTVLGKIRILEENEKVIKLEINPKEKEKEAFLKDTPFLINVANQLDEYFSGKRKQFSLQTKQEGTTFQQKVWKELEKIPYGKTMTYGEIAKRIGNPKATRAVGMANHENQIPIIIPCHRVIGSNGKLVGYALGLRYKTKTIGLRKRKRVNYKIHSFIFFLENHK